MTTTTPTPDQAAACYVCGAAAWQADHLGPLCPDHFGVILEYNELLAAPLFPEAPAISAEPEVTACPICKRHYTPTGRSIHYCYPSHEYICHFDNQQVGVGYPNHTAAETALDDYCWWLNEAGLVGELDTVLDPRD